MFVAVRSKLCPSGVMVPVGSAAGATERHCLSVFHQFFLMWEIPVVGWDAMVYMESRTRKASNESPFSVPSNLRNICRESPVGCKTREFKHLLWLNMDLNCGGGYLFCQEPLARVTPTTLGDGELRYAEQLAQLVFLSR